MAYIVGKNRNQGTLIPEYLEDFISDENPVRVFDAFVNSLDMQACGFKRYIPAKEGRPGYDPRHLLKLYIYGYFNKVRTSRGLSKETKRNLEVMWLLNKLTPDFRTISDFRKDNPKALKEVFKAFNRLCDSLKLYSKELFSIDGSKFKAVNSKDNNFTLLKLDDRLKRLDAQIAEYMKLIDENDMREVDERNFTHEEIAETVKNLQNRKEKYSIYRTELEESGASQKSLTDPESKLMKFSKNYDVGYNVQSVVDAGNHMIAGFEVTDNPSDHGLLEVVATGVKVDFGLDEMETIADSGYRDSTDIMNCLEAGIIPNVFPAEGETHIELTTEYESCEVTSDTLKSKNPEDIKMCLHVGLIPNAYGEIISEIVIVEKVMISTSEDMIELSETELIQKAREGFFVRDLKSDKVYCPQGKILRKKSTNKNGNITYANKRACKSCSCKCTKSSFKRVNFPQGQTLSVSLSFGSREIWKENLKKRFSGQRSSKK